MCIVREKAVSLEYEEAEDVKTMDFNCFATLIIVLTNCSFENMKQLYIKPLFSIILLNMNWFNMNVVGQLITIYIFCKIMLHDTIYT